MDFTDATNVSASLDSYGLLPEDVKNAVEGFKGIPEDSANAVLHMAQTGKVDIGTVTPLLAAGLAATGVGAPAAAVVSIALPLVESLGNALGLFGSPAPHYTYTVNDYGFTNSIPYGPTDPLWRKWPDFVAKTWVSRAKADLARQTMGAAFAPNTPGSMYKAFPHYDVIDDDLKGVADYPKGRFAGLPKGAVDFIKAYLGAWSANAERQINGHKGADDGAMLQAVSTAWQRSHNNDKKYTFQLAPDGSKGYIPFILGGNFDGARRPALTINVGDPLAAPVTRTLPKPSPALAAQVQANFGAALSALQAHKAHSFSIVKDNTKYYIGAALAALIAGFLILKGKR